MRIKYWGILFAYAPECENRLFISCVKTIINLLFKNSNNTLCIFKYVFEHFVQMCICIKNVIKVKEAN